MACGAAALRGDPAGHFERPQRAAAVVDDDRRALGREPLGDGAPEEVAGVAAFLAGESAGWVTGQNVQAGGGVV